MDRRRFLSTLAAAPFVQTASKAAAKRPNVVMFMTDDHGAWATGAYGCAEMHTPNIDELARTGARFDRAFACTPVCSPSRMTWITGKIPSVHGVQDWLRPEDSFETNTRRWLEGHTPYSTILAANGYELGMCGKWHMGEDDKAQYGFKYWATVPGGGGPYRNVEFVKNGQKTRLSEFKTDSVGDCALEFLEQARNNPFYLLVPFYAPHTPFDFQPETYRAHYNDSKFSCFPPDAMHQWQNPGLKAHHGNRKSMHSYSALVSGVDANIGRVLRKLEQLGLRGDTTVVFTADQGWNAGHHGVWGKGNGTWPFNMYDQSIRVPLIWNHPGRIRGGQTLQPMVSSYDYFPTLMDYLGIKAAPDARRMGRSYSGLLRGRKTNWQNRLFFEYSFVRGVRTENLKLIRRTKQWPSEFYDLERDPDEARNLIDDPSYAAQIAALDKEMSAWFARAGAPELEAWRGTTRQNLTQYSR